MSANIQPCPSLVACDRQRPAASSVRFGITVARNQAQRAVARNTIKRVLREAARGSAQALHTAAPAVRIDIVLRLKAALPDKGTANWSSIKAQVRREAESLIAQLRRELCMQSSGQTDGRVAGRAEASR